MTNYLKISYGGYAYQSTIDLPATFTEGQPGRLRTSLPPGVDGAFTAGGLLGARRPSIKGTLTVPGTGVVQTDLATLRNAWDNFKAVHAPGLPKQLIIDDDRYLNCEVETIGDVEWNGLLYKDYLVTFFAADPYWYSVVLNSVTFGAGLGGTVTTNGTGTAKPIITIPITAAPAGGLITLSVTGGATCTLSPDAAATFIIDTTQETVTSSGVDKTTLFGGEFLRLAAGANTVNITASNAATFGAVQVQWRDRWY